MGFKEKFKAKMEDRSYEEHLMKNYIKRRERAEARTNAYSYFLAAVCAIISVIFFIHNSALLGSIFLGGGALLILLVYLTKVVEKKEAEKSEKSKKE